jgi:hypothetical protein
MGRRHSFPTIDVSPADSDVEIVSDAKPVPLHPKGDGPSMAAFPLTRTTGERKFWSGASQGADLEAPASEDDEDDDLVAAGVPRRTWTARGVISKLLFAMIGLVVLALLACEISIAYKVPWLDPRPALASAERVVNHQIARLRGRQR